jgi:adenylate cyclase
VLFADVRGYTKLTEGIPPAEVPALMNRYYETASAALLGEDGLLGQIEGDNVMALFVPGLAGKGYKRSAVRGGLSLLRAVGFGSDEGPWLTIGAGIATGEQFIGNVGGGGYKDFTALGDVTNTAARLTAQAGPGELLVDADTYAVVAREHPSADRRELHLKGKARPVVAYALEIS